ncbi:MAG: RNA-binding S4 domain-containing protein [Planctomycetaceae bacterium]
MSDPLDTPIRDETIDLDQFLKYCGACSSGGEAKYFINEEMVMVNGEQEQRRRRTLRIGDIVEIQDVGSFRVATSESE